MSRQEAIQALERALAISRELAAVAENGDTRVALRLDAERLRLLQSVRHALQPMDEKDRAVLREIAELNDRSIGLLEHRFRAKCPDMDMLSAGRRAMPAYTTTRP